MVFRWFLKKSKKHDGTARPDNEKHNRDIIIIAGADDDCDANGSLELVESMILPNDMRAVDLKLEQHKTPLDMETFHSLWTPLPSQRLMDAQIPSKTYAIGSAKMNDEIYYKHNTGLFQCIHEAWINHWNLRTTPEDWWFPVACLVSKTLAEATMSSNGICKYTDETAQQIRNQLVYNSTQREKIAVDIPASTIYEPTTTADYGCVMDEISLQLYNSIKVPELVTVMTNDFSTSTSCHTIASQANLMSGLQHCFDYQTDFTACGLRGVEMLGTQQDWDRLYQKLMQLQDIVKTIFGKQFLEIYFEDAWWEHTAMCFRNLALTFSNSKKSVQQKQQLKQFWRDIIIPTQFGNRNDNKYDKGPRTHMVDAFEGWLIHLLVGRPRTIRANEIKDRADVQEHFHGMNKVPLTVRLLTRQGQGLHAHDEDGEQAPQRKMGSSRTQPN